MLTLYLAPKSTETSDQSNSENIVEFTHRRGINEDFEEDRYISVSDFNGEIIHSSEPTDT